MKRLKSWHEPTVLALIFLAFFALNIVTSPRFPLPWQDEDVFVDVAVNLATGQGFVSTVNMCGKPDISHFWSCNAPLFPFILGHWIKVFGFSIRAVRSLNYLLMIGSAAILWFAVRHLKIIPRARERLLLVGLLFAGYGMGFVYRSARYDCLGLLLISLILLSFTIRFRSLRNLIIGFIGVILPLAGIQLVLYVAVMSTILLVFLKKRVLWEALSLAAGIPVGVGMLIAIYYENGVLSEFLSDLAGERVGHLHYVSKDPSFAILLCVSALLFFYMFRLNSFRFDSPLSIGLACGVFVPSLMIALGKFPIYYSWMAYVPLTIGVSAVLRRAEYHISRSLLTAVLCGLLLVCLVGLPLQLGLALYYWRSRDCSQIDALDRNTLTADDWVYTEYSGYFGARKITTHVFMPFIIPDKYRNKISVLIVSREDYRNFAHAIIGGQWRDTGMGIPDTGHDVLSNSSAGILLQRRIELEVYRRIAFAESTP